MPNTGREVKMLPKQNKLKTRKMKKYDIQITCGDGWIGYIADSLDDVLSVLDKEPVNVSFKQMVYVVTKEE